MARIKQMRLSLGSTVNLGNFNSARVDVDMMVELAEGEDPAAAWGLLKRQVRGRIDEMLTDLSGSDKKPAAPTPASRPAARPSARPTISPPQTGHKPVVVARLPVR